MTIKELCKACAEYDHNITKINILKSSIDGNKKHSHLKWAVDRDTESLNKLIDRQIDIQELITDNNKITF